LGIPVIKTKDGLVKQKSFTYQKEQPWPLVLGIDVSPTSIKYLLLRRKLNSTVIEAYGKFTVSDQEYDLSAKVEEIFTNIIPKSIWKKAKIVVGFDSPRLIVKRESFPRMSVKDMKQAVELGLMQQIENESGETAVKCDFIPIGSDPELKGNTRYVVFGLPENEIFDKLYAFTNNHIVPHKAVPSIVILSNLLQFIPREERNGNSAILDIGAEHSVLVFFKDGQIDFYREIAVGGDDFTKSVTGTIFHEGRAIQFSAEEALEFKCKYGYPLGFADGMTFRGAPLTEVGAMMRPVVERLSGEIHRSLVFYKENSGGEEISSLYLIGGGAKLNHLTEVLSENVSIPVSTFPIPEKIRVIGSTEDQKRFEQKFLEQAVCLSVAFEASAEKNLLPEPFLKVHKNAIIQKYMAYAAGLIVLILLVISNGVSSQNKKLKREVSAIEARIRKSPSRGDEFAALQKKQKELSSKLAELNSKVYQDSTLTQLLKLVSNVIPENIKLISVDLGKEDAKPKTSRRRSAQQKNKEPEKPKTVLKLGGWTKNPPYDIGVYLAKFVVELEKSGYFDEVVVNEEEYIEEENSYAFSLSAYLKQ